MKRIYTVLVLLKLIIICQLLYAYPAEVVDLSNRDYADAVLDVVHKAKESIVMVMYLISYNEKDKDSDVYRLMQALKNAHDRGVKVSVILDYRSAEDKEQGAVSYYAYRFLKEAGIKVSFDTPRVYTHNKTIVVDNNVVIAGSANWSRAAMERSNETNLLIESPELALSVLERIRKIELIPEKNITVNKEEVPVPFVLLKSKGVFQDMVRRSDERSYDIYLFLLASFEPGKNGKVAVTYKEIAKSIGMRREDYRDMLNRTLRKLRDRYKLIDAHMSYGKPVEICLLVPEREKPVPGWDDIDCVQMPRQFWIWGWDRRLNLVEKYCYLINLAEVKGQTQWNEWMLTRDQLAEKYGVSCRSISKGMIGLREFGIIDIEYGEVDKGYDNRMPAVTRVLGLYNYDEFQKAIVELEEKQGKGKVALARRYAKVVFRSYDIESICDVLEFMEVYGQDRVKKAFAKVAKKEIDNPKRSFKYVVGILQKEGVVKDKRSD